MNRTDKAKRFAELHVKGTPLLLYNVWDAGSAKSILAAGARAIATSSWSVAEAHGYRDGEAIPIELAERIVGRIAATIDPHQLRHPRQLAARGVQAIRGYGQGRRPA
jgi:2-methylisocitrate lyase-like PEP mutase family enzyme